MRTDKRPESPAPPRRRSWISRHPAGDDALWLRIHWSGKAADANDATDYGDVWAEEVQPVLPVPCGGWWLPVLLRDALAARSAATLLFKQQRGLFHRSLDVLLLTALVSLVG